MGLFSFKYELFINFWLQVFDTRKEIRFLKVFCTHTVLTTPPTFGTSRGPISISENYGRTPTSHHHGRAPTSHHHGRAPTSQHHGRTPTSHHHGRTPTSQHYGRTPTSQHHGRTPTSQHHGQTPTSQHHGRTPTSQHHGRNSTSTQLSTYMLHSQLPTDSFSKSSISQAHHFRTWRHSHSSLISYLGFIMIIVIVISFARGRKTVPNVCAPELRAELF